MANPPSSCLWVVPRTCGFRKVPCLPPDKAPMAQSSRKRHIRVHWRFIRWKTAVRPNPTHKVVWPPSKGDADTAPPGNPDSCVSSGKVRFQVRHLLARPFVVCTDGRGCVQPELQQRTCCPATVGSALKPDEVGKENVGQILRASAACRTWDNNSGLPTRLR